MSSPVAEALAALTEALHGIGTGWYLFGAQAALLYGSRRLTADIDVTVLLDGETTEELLARLTAHGFGLRVADVEQFVVLTRVLPLVHVRSGMPVDVVLGGPGLDELFLDASLSLELDGQKVPVVRPEHLIVTKLLAGRPHDFEDARAVARATELDGQVIEELVEAIAEGLGEDDLRRAWAQLRRELGRP